MSLPTLAVCIPTKNRHQELARSLATVLPMARRAGARIYVCDQSPTPFAHPALVVWHRPELPGLPAARNALLALVREDIVLFLDDDCDTAADLGERLRQLAAEEPEFAGWGAVAETRGPWSRRLHRLLHLGCLRDARRLLARRCDRETRELFGCCFAVRRAALLAIGGFDARRRGYALGEDRDACWRLCAAGQRLRFVAAWRVHHRESGGQQPALGARLAYLWWFASRHGRGNPATLLHVWQTAAAWTALVLLQRLMRWRRWRAR
ncbi:MAG: glycosyltransferase [Planctomycetota bacterium]|nr:glycosyltransferase [Planctomycetota bacterium]MCX8039705.1 glycosyltransferase [Planctomycetota bacterium]MDW8372885.1 glycosyltransferase [Planctomycetota bacterium]